MCSGWYAGKAGMQVTKTGGMQARGMLKRDTIGKVMEINSSNKGTPGVKCTRGPESRE